MDYLDKLDTKTLFGMIENDLKLCMKNENDAWGTEEYELMLRIIKEIKLRFSLAEKQ